MSIEETADDLSLSPGQLDGSERARYLVHVYRAGDEHPEPTRHRLTGRGLVLGRRPGPGGVELHDTAVSREHAELVHDRASDTYRVVDRDSRNGTFVGGLRVQSRELAHGAVIRVGSSLFVFVDVALPTGLVLDELPPGAAIARLVAEASADLAAPTELPILVLGPTGAGKEVLAQRIHEKSRRKGALVAVNCATLSRDLVAAELFGHTAGAFSGAAKARSGLFVAADGGTLMLDEIAELPLDQQASLLRAIQERRVRPVGADHEVPVDVRIVAATHQSLERMERAGQFRADLHARLAGFVVELPGLAARREEILPLFRAFVAEPSKRLTRDAAEALLLHPWPHNVRELKHAAERARLLAASTAEIDVAQLPPALVRRGAPGPADTFDDRPPTPPAAPPAPEALAPRDVEPTKDELVAMLVEHGGNVAEICRRTGRHRQQVYRWLKRHGLELESFRRDDVP
ncbi:sigma 54-interacting transcriptional regulator [Myxococcota bacterium]|nr:sigma 54-interacting transcriptional regulator [Myxococcota bacterium]